jgi:putative exporter of polyketide antibiotics
MDVLIEAFIFLGLSLFFSVFYEMERDEHLWGALVGGLCWTMLGLVYMLWDRPTYTFSLFFGVLGIIYVARFISDAFHSVHLGRRLSGDND